AGLVDEAAQGQGDGELLRREQVDHLGQEVVPGAATPPPAGETPAPDDAPTGPPPTGPEGDVDDGSSPPL
ncbi:hypothetical protein AB0J43_35935, partial [Nonomuraea fuscirosea]